jgi:Domain of Unknown Function (DUF928)
MKVLAATFFLLVSLVWLTENGEPGLAQSSPPQAPAESAASQPPTKHAHVVLDGFELEPAAAGSPAHSGGATVFLSAPNHARVYSLTPTLYWTSGVHTPAFVFRLFDMEGDVGYKTRIPGFSLRYPSDAPALEPGKTYVWNVLAGLGLQGGGSLPAKFTVLSPEERTALDKQLAGADSMQRAAIFTDKRLWYDAIQAYTELIAQHPAMPELYEKRGDIFDQIPATQSLAQSDFAKARELRAKK